MREQLQWTTPAPLWGAASAAALAARRSSLLRPAILRFASDNFMEEFINLMQIDPARLGELVAQYETWRGTLAPPTPVKPLPKFLQPLNRLRLAAERKKSAPAQSELALSLTQPDAALSLTPQQPALNPTPPKPLKLYQPTHQRFYLLTACLVCARTGLPDRAVNPGRQERVGFIVRRLLPPDYKDAATDARGLPVPLPAPDESWDEYALVTAAEGHGWRKVAKSADGGANVLLDGEELLPLFPVNYNQDDGRKRRILAGLVPAGKREAYMGAPLLPPTQSQTDAATSNTTNNTMSNTTSDEESPVDPRMMPLWLQVTEPWKRLIERADAVRAMQNAPTSNLSQDEPLPTDALTRSLKATREQVQTGSWYILLDFTKYLAEYLPDVWQVVSGQQPESSLANKAAELDLLNALKTTALPDALIAALSTPARYNGRVKPALVDALKAIQTEGAEAGLESVAGSYDREQPDAAWPAFLFPFADATLEPLQQPLPTSITLPPIANEKAVETAVRTVEALANLIKAALPKTTQAPPPESALPLVAQRPLDMREGWFTLRCVYERPECGPLDPPLLSEPTAPFQLAGFFDPDAPARPLRIALPIDTSPAGLRKFDKNAAFIMSDMLCGQINRMKGITLGDLVRTVLPWPLHKDLDVPDTGPCKQTDANLQLGMICSLSIPIVTICALLLLMIIVSLLDFIFRWLPYFLICFPLPGLSAGKKQGT
jgi:hypothetical protein